MAKRKAMFSLKEGKALKKISKSIEGYIEKLFVSQRSITSAAAMYLTKSLLAMHQDFMTEELSCCFSSFNSACGGQY
jgi:hypothetical protein